MYLNVGDGNFFDDPFTKINTSTAHMQTPTNTANNSCLGYKEK